MSAGKKLKIINHSINAATAVIIPKLEIIEDFEFGLDAAIGVRYQF